MAGNKGLTCYSQDEKLASAIPQAVLDGADVVAHRPLGQVQAGGDLWVVQAARDQAQDVRLLLGQLAGHPRVDKGLASHGATHGFQELLTRGVPEEVPIGPGPHRVEDPLVIIVGGQDQDLYIWVTGPNLVGGLDPVRPGHLQVHHDKVGVFLYHKFDSLHPILGI